MRKTIGILRNGIYQEVLGHGCTTEEEMKEYINTLDPSGTWLKIIEVE